MILVPHWSFKVCICSTLTTVAGLFKEMLLYFITCTEKGNTIVATSVIVVGELFFMAENSQQKTANLQVVQAFVQSIDIYQIDKEIAKIYGQFKAEIISRFGSREKSRRRTTRIEELGVSDNDLWIAATAVRHNLTVVSADSDFQRMQQVRAFPLECWIKIEPQKV